MLGHAQKLFQERYGRSPWLHGNSIVSWPTLQRLADLGSPLQLDAVWALRMINGLVEATEEVGLFLCFLFHSARQGHLCVKLTVKGLEPSPHELWRDLVDQNPHVLGGISSIELEQAVISGARQIPLSLVNPSTGILIIDSDRIYLKRFWQQETLVVEHLMRHLSAKLVLALPLDRMAQQLTACVSNGLLHPLQAQAIEQVCQSPLTLLTGGPGTGKTYTAAQLIRLMWDHAPNPEVFRVVATAPTGKAAANLADKLKHTLPPQYTSAVIVKTLHRLLKVRRRGLPLQAHFDADLVVVDESSMIDVGIMGLLLASIQSGTRIVLIGDRDQLPAVEAGGVFADCVAALDGSCVVSLEKCLRTESPEIIQFAANIRSGDVALTQPNDQGAVQVHEWFPNDDGAVQRALKVHMEPLLALPATSAPEALLHLLSQRRILTALRDGPWGVDQLNQRLAQMMRRHGPSMTPILITVNDYSQNLFNGDIGILVRDGHYAHVLFPEGDTWRELPAATLPRYELAYALSVHKSQGSEFDHVFLLLPPRSGVFGREMLYTAATRARKSLHIWTTKEVLQSLVSRPMSRVSGLTDRLGKL